MSEYFKFAIMTLIGLLVGFFLFAEKPATGGEGANPGDGRGEHGSGIPGGSTGAPGWVPGSGPGKPPAKDSKGNTGGSGSSGGAAPGASKKGQFAFAGNEGSYPVPDSVYTGTIVGGLKAVQAQHGQKMAEVVEQIYRVETRHFQSVQFKKTGSAGMLMFSDKYPYGWKMVKDFWGRGVLSPVGYYATDKTSDKSSKLYRYLAFRSTIEGMLTLAAVLKYRGRPGYWNSTDAKQAAEYEKLIASVTPRFAKELA